MGRRLSQHEMTIIRRDDAILNSQIKRGLASPRSNNSFHCVCGCGGMGCVFTSYIPQTVLPLDQRPQN